MLIMGICVLGLALSACEAAQPIQATQPTRENTSTRKNTPAKTPPGPTNPLHGLKPAGMVEEAELRPMPDGVIDGDTLKAVGYAKNLRLINIDTEEVFKDRNKAAMAAQNWKEYLKKETRGASPKSFATPMGEKARDFARDFFRDTSSIWLEYQSATYTRGFFERHLVLVWVKKDNQWVNYNIEAVRQGMSPYYTKYGYSARLHAAFEAAEAEAKKAQRGIWAPGAQAYPDYPERIALWTKRARQIDGYRRIAAEQPAIIDLASDTAFADLRQQIGERVVVFGDVVSFADKSDPQRLRLSFRFRRDLPVVASKPVDMRKSGVTPKKQQFIYIEGVVGLYRGDPQIIYDQKSWMRAPDNPPRP